jgi:protein-disulfide isomerase
MTAANDPLADVARRLALTGGLGLAGFAVAGAALAKPKLAAKGRDKVGPNAHGPPLLGQAKAPKRFSLWGSLTCPYTAELYPVLTEIVQDNPDRVALNWRHFPTHPPDPALHVAASAFEGPHFWGFVGDVLAIVWADGGSYARLTPDKLAELAQAQGGSQAALTAAYADPAKWKTVKDDFLAGQLMGVVRTPGLFYDGYFLTAAGMPSDLPGFDKSLRDMIAAG